MPPEPVLYLPDPASVRRIGVSPPSWMVRLALEEKAVPHRLRWLSFARGEHRSPELLALNPAGTVPVLAVGGVALAESIAMLHLVEHLWPDPPLLPVDLPGRARALDALQAADGLKRAGMALLAHVMRHDDAPASLTEPVAAQLDRWEASLDDGMVAGAAPTAADLVVFVYTATLWRLGWPLPDRLEAHRARMAARPSVQATWPETWGDGRLGVLRGAGP